MHVKNAVWAYRGHVWPHVVGDGTAALVVTGGRVVITLDVGIKDHKIEFRFLSALPGPMLIRDRLLENSVDLGQLELNVTGGGKATTCEPPAQVSIPSHAQGCTVCCYPFSGTPSDPRCRASSLRCARRTRTLLIRSRR